MKNWSQIIISFLFVSGVSVAKANLTEPKVSRGKVELGVDISKALKDYNKNFKLLEAKNFSKDIIEMTEELPMAALGDYNGDGVQDVVVYGIDLVGKKAMILAVISEKNIYKVYSVFSGKLEKVDLFRNEQYIVPGNAQALKASKRNSFSIEYYDGMMGSSNTYYFSLKHKKIKLLLHGTKAD